MEKPKFKPIRDKILVKRCESETVTKSGIILPESSVDKPLRGEVITTGNGTKDEPMTIEPGDMVIFGEYCGEEIELEGETYLVLVHSDVQGIIQ